MSSSSLSDRKPGLGSAFLVLLIFLLAALIITGALFLNRQSNGYDDERSTKRFETLKLLREENLKKTTEYAVLEKAKGTYQLPIKDAMALTITELSMVQPTAAYPIATPAPVEATTPEAAAPETVAAPNVSPSPAAPAATSGIVIPDPTAPEATPSALPETVTPSIEAAPSVTPPSPDGNPLTPGPTP